MRWGIGGDRLILVSYRDFCHFFLRCFWCNRSEKCVGACMMECENLGSSVWVVGLRGC